MDKIKLTPVSEFGENECALCGEDGRAYAICHNGEDIGGYIEACRDHAKEIALNALWLSPDLDIVWEVNHG